MVLARTDPEAEKHKGITYFVVDMHAPGVEVRPLRQMTGDAEFNEVYFTDVRIPDSERLGDAGDGWRGAIVTLMNERVSIGGAVVPRGGGPDRHRRGPVEAAGPRARAIAATRDRLMQLWVEAEVQRLTNLRAAANSQHGTPGPEGSTAKLAFAELNKRIYDFCVDLLGPEGMLYDSYEMRRPGGAGRPRAACPAACSCGPGPTPSRAGRPRSCATSSASGSSASPVTSAPTRGCPGRRFPATSGSAATRVCLATGSACSRGSASWASTTSSRHPNTRSNSSRLRRRPHSSRSMSSSAWTTTSTRPGLV